MSVMLVLRRVSCQRKSFGGDPSNGIHSTDGRKVPMTEIEIETLSRHQVLYAVPFVPI